MERFDKQAAYSLNPNESRSLHFQNLDVCLKSGLLIFLILPSFPLGLEGAQIFPLASTLNRERQNKSVFTHHQRQQPRTGQRQYGLLQLGYLQSIVGVCCHMPSLPALRDPSDRFDLPDGLSV